MTNSKRSSRSTRRLRELQAEWNRRRARTSLLEFIRFVWWKPTPFLIGRHTRAICAEIDGAIERFLAGQSSFIDIACPFRHGKSDMVSRALPAYFLGRCLHLHPDIIMSGYGADLVEGFSKESKAIIRSDAYRVLFPAVVLARGSDAAGSWRLHPLQDMRYPFAVGTDLGLEARLAQLVARRAAVRQDLLQRRPVKPRLPHHLSLRNTLNLNLRLACPP